MIKRSNGDNVQLEKEKLYTASEAADKIGVHPQTVKKWHREGKLRAVKIGERWLRFPSSEIDRILGN